MRSAPQEIGVDCVIVFGRSDVVFARWWTRSKQQRTEYKWRSWRSKVSCQTSTTFLPGAWSLAGAAEVVRGRASPWLRARRTSSLSQTRGRQVPGRAGGSRTWRSSRGHWCWRLSTVARCGPSLSSRLPESVLWGLQREGDLCDLSVLRFLAICGGERRQHIQRWVQICPGNMKKLYEINSRNFGPAQRNSVAVNVQERMSKRLSWRLPSVQVQK